MIAALELPLVTEREFDLIAKTCLICGAVGFALAVIGLCAIAYRRLSDRDDLMDVAESAQGVGPDMERLP